MRHAKSLFLVGLTVLAACGAMVFGSYRYEDVNEARAIDQTNFEDSTKVFFTTYPNPYPDKDFLWFAVYIEGLVEMHVHSLESDSLQSVYHFSKQDVPVHTVALHKNKEHLVKCVLYVNGRMKCAKVYTDWQPVELPQFKTHYVVTDK